MKANPVYKRETMASVRGFRLAFVLMAFNGILALVALLNMYSALEQVKRTAEVQYASFLDLYFFVAVLEFIMIVFLMPALTAGGISGERERRTLEIMLTTRLTPRQIVWGKLLAAMNTMGLVIISSMPILCLVFVYGGVMPVDMVMLFLSYMTAALFIGGIGICCSAIFRKSMISTVAAYAAVAVVIVGTYAVNWIAVYVGRLHPDAYLASTGQMAAAGNAGILGYLLLVNPASTFMTILLRLTGYGQGTVMAGQWIGGGGILKAEVNWIIGSTLLQLVIALLFLWTAARVLTPGKRGIHAAAWLSELLRIRKKSRLLRGKEN